MGCGTSAIKYTPHPNFNMDVEPNVSAYTKVSELGCGGSCVVSKVQCKNTKAYYALKRLGKELDNKARRAAFQTEVDILQTLKHPNVLKLEQAWSDKNGSYIITGLLTGGEMFDRVVAKDLEACTQLTEEELDVFLRGKGLTPKGDKKEKAVALCSAMKASDPPFTDKIAARLVQQMLRALEYIHANNISHRDLKPENFVFHDVVSFNLCLIDFGMALMGPDTTRDRSMCGTVFYVAPEVTPNLFPSAGLTQKAWKQADMWSLGVCVYTLLTGQIPWLSDDEDDIFEEIEKAVWKFPSDFKPAPSAGAMDFVRQCMVKNPGRRMTAEQALKHPWVQGETATNVEVSKLVQQNLRAYGKLTKLRKAAGHLLANSMSDEDRVHLKALFKVYDKDHTGQLNPTQVKAFLDSLASTKGYSATRKFRKNLVADKTGNVNIEEFLAAHARVTFDFRNKDEVASLYTMNEQEVKEMMQDCGVQESKVDFDHFAKMIEESRVSESHHDSRDESAFEHSRHMGRSSFSISRRSFSFAREPSLRKLSFLPSLPPIDPPPGVGGFGLLAPLPETNSN